MRSGRRALLAALLGLAAAGAHAGALGCGFIAYDDDMYVYRNPHLREGFTPRAVRWAFTAHLTHDALPHLDYWQPVTVLSRLLDVELFGLDPRGHHATNVLLHGLNAALLFLVLASLTGAPWRSALVAGLFGLHPLRVESVVWVTERKDVLSGLFWLLAIGAYMRWVRGPRPARYAALLAAFALGLMAKAMVVTLPFVLLLLDGWPLRRVGPGNWKPLRALAVEKAPLFALAAASLLVTVIATSRGDYFVPLGPQPWTDRAGAAIVEYARTAWRFLWPFPMALPQPFPVRPWPAATVAACAAVLAAATAVTGRAYSRRPYLAVGWLWFLGTLAPVIGAVQAGAQPVADRFTYIPHIGLAIAASWALADALPRPRPRWVAFAVAAVLAALATATVGQARHWRDSVTLFRHAAESTRDNYAAHFNLANALAAAHGDAEAAFHYRRTIAIKPDHARAHNNLANLLAAEGRHEEAIGHYREALRLAPAYADAHNNLGLLLAARGAAADARHHYREAVRARPGNAEALYNLGRLDAREGRTADATGAFAAAAAADPDFAAPRLALGNLLAQAGRLAEAEAQFREAVRLRPGDADARNNLGRALDLQGRAADARAEYEAAARASPGHALARANLGRLLAAEGRFEEAATHLREVVRLRPDDPEARLTLGRALSGLGRAGEACAEYREALRLGLPTEEARAAAAGCAPPGTARR
jgi:tetratricopeptide (TPR) repeat protein